MWNFKNGLKKALRGHFDDVYAIAISKDSNILVSGSYDTTIIIWNPKKY